MYESHGPVMKAHFIDMGQANATLLEFKCGVVLIDAGAQDDVYVDGLVDFITSVFVARPELDSTLEAGRHRARPGGLAAVALLG